MISTTRNTIKGLTKLFAQPSLVNHLDRLDLSTINYIFRFLSALDLTNFASTCKKIKDEAHTHRRWSEFLLEEFKVKNDNATYSLYSDYKISQKMLNSIQNSFQSTLFDIKELSSKKQNIEIVKVVFSQNCCYVSYRDFGITLKNRILEFNLKTDRLSLKSPTNLTVVESKDIISSLLVLNYKDPQKYMKCDLLYTSGKSLFFVDLLNLKNKNSKKSKNEKVKVKVFHDTISDMQLKKDSLYLITDQTLSLLNLKNYMGECLNSVDLKKYSVTTINCDHGEAISLITGLYCPPHENFVITASALNIRFWDENTLSLVCEIRLQQPSTNCSLSYFNSSLYVSHDHSGTIKIWDSKEVLESKSITEWVCDENKTVVKTIHAMHALVVLTMSKTDGQFFSDIQIMNGLTKKVARTFSFPEEIKDIALRNNCLYIIDSKGTLKEERYLETIKPVERRSSNRRFSIIR